MFSNHIKLGSGDTHNQILRFVLTRENFFDCHDAVNEVEIPESVRRQTGDQFNEDRNYLQNYFEMFRNHYRHHFAVVINIKTTVSYRFNEYDYDHTGSDTPIDDLFYVYTYAEVSILPNVELDFNIIKLKYSRLIRDLKGSTIPKIFDVVNNFVELKDDILPHRHKGLYPYRLRIPCGHHHE